MEKYKITTGVFVALFLVVTGAYIIVNKEHTYYCQSKDLAGYCERLSAKHTRCYYFDYELNKTSYKVCPEGWQPIREFINISYPQQVKVFANNKTYSCEVLNGSVNSYSHCLSDKWTEAYLGELV